MAEDPKAIALGEILRRYWEKSFFFSTMGSYPITGLCSKRSPWSSTTTLAGGASGGASWQFQEPDRRPKDFGHDGHNTAVNPASVQRQFIPCLSHALLLVIGVHQVHHTFSACAGSCRSTESLSIMFFFVCFPLPPFSSSFPASIPPLPPFWIYFFWCLSLWWRGFRYPPAPNRSLPFSHQRSLIFYHIFWFPLNPSQPPDCWPLRQHRPVPRLAALPDNFKNRIDVERILGMMGMILVSILHQFRGSLSHVYAVVFRSTESLGICMNHAPLQQQDFWSFLFRIVKIYSHPQIQVECGTRQPPWKGKGGLELNFHIIWQKHISGWLLVCEATNHYKKLTNLNRFLGIEHSQHLVVYSCSWPPS